MHFKPLPLRPLPEVVWMKWLTPPEFRAAIFIALTLAVGSVVNHFMDFGVETRENAPETSLESQYSIFPIDLNQAGLKELFLLPAIGETKARAILAHRDEKGSYKSVQELLQVRGIGPKTLEKLEGLVTVGVVEAEGDSLKPPQAD